MIHKPNKAVLQRIMHRWEAEAYVLDMMLAASLDASYPPGKNYKFFASKAKFEKDVAEKMKMLSRKVEIARKIIQGKSIEPYKYL